VKHVTKLALVLGSIAGIAAVQEENRKIELAAQNREVGVEIRVPRSPGKEQMWEALLKSGEIHPGSAVLARHRKDAFAVEVNVVTKENDFMGDNMTASWPKPSTIAQRARDEFTREKDGKESVYKECKLVSEEPKAKLAGLPGAGYSHRLLLTPRKGDDKRELIEYFVINSDTLYRVTVSFTKESYEKHWAGEGQLVLNSVRKCKIDSSR
jgi:hypothetical protein